MGQLVDDLWKDQPHQTETSVPEHGLEPGSSFFDFQRGSSSQARSSGPYPSNVHGLGRGDSGPIRLVDSIEWDAGEVAACLINWEDLDHSEFQRPVIQQGNDTETLDLDNAEQYSSTEIFTSSEKEMMSSVSRASPPRS